MLMAGIARAQVFGEGNKRRALLLGRWVLDRNGIDGGRLLPTTDPELVDLLLRAARGMDVSQALTSLLTQRMRQEPE